MSGHNKWSTIKHKKGKTDAIRGKLFTKLIREIVVATKEGGDDVDGNARLRSAIITARGANMTKDTIDRAVLRGAGKLEGAVYEECTYEGYGPGGVAFFIETLTDNKNRTVAEVRHMLGKNGGNLGTDGSVAWMFERRGLIEVPKADHEFEAIFEAAVEAGGLDVEQDEETYSIYTEFTDLHGVAKALEQAGFEVANAKPTRVTDNLMAISGDDAARTFRLMMLIDDNDDVQNVYTNADISDEEMAAFADE